MSDTPQDPSPVPETPTAASPSQQPAPPQPDPPQPGPPGGYAPHSAAPMHAPSGGPQPQFAARTSSDDNTVAMLIHLSLLFTGFIGPLIIWLIKKDESPFIDRHGKTALNFSFTLMIAYVVSMILLLVLVGILTFIATIIVSIVFPIIAAIAANKGEEYKYPMSIPFFS